MQDRIGVVDAARGIAIIMMVAYHILFDLDYLGIIGIDIHWLPILLFQRITGMLFIMIAGISMTLSERRKKGYLRHLRRAAILGVVAIGITIATWIYPHEGFVTFGIIHFLALSTIIAPFFFRFGAYNIVLSVIVIATGLVLNGLTKDWNWLFPLGLTSPTYSALDYYPLLPWFGIVLLGIYSGQKLFVERNVDIPVPAWLRIIGKNSLAIYLIHQPVIVGIMMIMVIAKIL